MATPHTHPALPHFRGPWLIRPTPVGLQIIGGNVIVAVVPRLFDEPWAEANATAIAALPELLDAAKQGYFALVGAGGSRSDREVEALHDAITKAIGGAW